MSFRLKPGTLAMTLALASMTMLGPLATDMYLPSLPDIARTLSATNAQTQLTLSAFLIGYAAGQVLYGPLSDKYGRKPVLALGFGIFITACAVCAAALSIEQLITARFAQGFGAAGPVILARAIVRDLYEGPRAGRELALMGGIMGITPAVAPALGGVLQVWFGWRASFIVSVIGTAAILTALTRMLPETIRARRTEALSFANVFGSLAVVARHPQFRFYAALNALTYGGLFAFISASSFVLQGAYHQSEVAFGLMFGLIALGFMSGNFLGSRLNRLYGIDGTIRAGACLAGLGGVVQVVSVLALPGVPLALVLPMMLYTCGVGLIMPQSIAGAMAPFPERAGAASSLTGVIQMTFGAAVGIGLAAALPVSALFLPLTTAALGISAAALYFWRPFRTMG